jgi:hypothetical protein
MGREPELSIRSSGDGLTATPKGDFPLTRTPRSSPNV